MYCYKCQSNFVAAGSLAVVVIKLFRKAYLAVNAFPWLELIVHLLNMLVDVAALPELFVADLNRAFEGLVLRVGTHVIDKF